MKATGGPDNRGLTSLDRIEEARLLIAGEEGSAEPQAPDPSHRLPPPVPAARSGADNGRCIGVAARRVTEGLAERVPAGGLAAVAGGGHVVSPESRFVRSTGRTARFNSFAHQFGYRVPRGVYVKLVLRLPFSDQLGLGCTRCFTSRPSPA